MITPTSSFDPFFAQTFMEQNEWSNFQFVAFFFLMITIVGAELLPRDMFTHHRATESIFAKLYYSLLYMLVPIYYLVDSRLVT